MKRLLLRPLCWVGIHNHGPYGEQYTMPNKQDSLDLSLCWRCGRFS